MRFTTSVEKHDIGLDLTFHRHTPMTPKLRTQAIQVAVDRALKSFKNAVSCKIECVEYIEYTATDSVAAQITLDIGGTGYGGDL